MTRNDIEKRLIELKSKREKHLCSFVEYIKSLAEKKSSDIFTDYCSVCQAIDSEEKELLKQLIELL